LQKLMRPDSDLWRTTDNGLRTTGKSMQKFFLTTPIYYPNARPHVGSAYTTIVCDVIARYKRMCGYDVAFLTGTDEHGEKLERAARAAGVSPPEFVAEKRKLFIELWKKLGIENLRFVYTDQPDHIVSVQRLLKLAIQNSPGVIYKGQYQGRYCVSDERYIADGSDPVNCDVCGRPAELISEENYFFKLSAFQDRLLQLYDQGFVKPDIRRNEVLSFVKSGLRDISVSRKRIKWGIPWPGDPEQVFYVWYDALTSYMTGIGYAQGEHGNEEFRKYWRNKPGEAEILHMIGKDILRFHAVYWPAFIMAAYPDQPEMLPTEVFAHGWIYYDQEKMSKSKGNVVFPEPIVDALESLGAPGNDALRYYLLREAPFGQDMSFSYEGLIQRYNSDLANGLGNLASRTLAMIARYCDGRIPRVQPALEGLWRRPEAVVSREEFVKNINSAYESLQFSNAAETIWGIVAHYGDQFLAQYQPWLIAEDPTKRALLESVLFIALEAVRAVVVLAHPIIPEATQKLWGQLGCEDDKGKIEDQRIDQLKWGELKPGTKVGKPEPIFPRLDKAATLAKLDEFAEADLKRETRKEQRKAMPTGPEKPPSSSPVPSPQPPAPSPEKISIEDFAKVEMRTGEIKSAERVPGANKLLKLLVDIGSEVRQVVAGIAEYYEPDKLAGMKVVLVTNLQPRKLRGVESNGMIVAASVEPEGRPVLVTFKEDVPNGTRLK